MVGSYCHCSYELLEAEESFLRVAKKADIAVLGCDV